MSMFKIEELMAKQSNIRNISVIAHVDHGKSTLTDTLVVKAKICAESASGGRYMDTREDEQLRGITIKSTAISMHFNIDQKALDLYAKEKHEGTGFLINLIDSPGHVDFSSEVTAALRATDGALVIIDCVDGFCVQTATVLRQALSERIKPTLVLNKLDRELLELHQDKVELMNTLKRRIEEFNVKIETMKIGYEKDGFEVSSLLPERNEVSFCSGLQGWGFTLKKFAKFYLKQLKCDTKENGESVACKILWSEKVFFSSDDPFDENGKFMPSGPENRKAFVVFVLNPIYTVRDLCENGDIEGVKEYLKKYDISFDNIKLEGSGKTLFRDVMRKWLPAADTLLEQIVLNLPSPKVSQTYRASHLYEGPADDACATAIKNASSDPEGPLMMYVSKMVPSNDSRFIAFGRVFSGTIKQGMKVRIQGPDYVPGGKEDLYIKQIQKVVVMMGRQMKDVESCPAGNIIGLMGIDGELKKTGTITNREEAHNIKNMKFSVSPVVKYAIKPKDPNDLSKLKAGLIKLSKSDPLAVVSMNENGEMTIAGAGELHLEICLKDLEDDYARVKIIVDEPSVNYLEGITDSVTDIKMAKSANKHNKIFMTCEQLSEELIENIDNGKLVHKDPKERAAKFREIVNINEDWVKKIMFYGPDDKGCNIVVDGTKGIAYLAEIKEYLRQGFRDVTSKGPLIGENLRGVRFDMNDVTLHSDAIHRTGIQISAPMTSVCKGLILAAEPTLYEPIFFAEINVLSEQMSGVTSTINQRRGTTESFVDEGGSRTIVTGYIPVKESFGFNAALLKATRGQASCILTFSHYAQLPGSIAQPNSILAQTVAAVRKKRHMPELRSADCYFDKA
ncbi:Translation elongation factor 2 [Spraguea lophii 42_110]|uniref:Elongation factor 2 n=1 Tax=Spraguea lophii (strain 42_110) TaxID=1358809 RepID=S7XLX5_SPRLO|nr:Translation elongation factor 2 [Spraguea lophii 42_110]